MLLYLLDNDKLEQWFEANELTPFSCMIHLYGFYAFHDLQAHIVLIGTTALALKIRQQNCTCMHL